MSDARTAIIYDVYAQHYDIQKLKEFVKENSIGEILYVITDGFVRNQKPESQIFSIPDEDDFLKILTLSNLRCDLITLFIGNLCQGSKVDLFLTGNKRLVADKSVFLLEDIYCNLQQPDVYRKNRYDYIADQTGLDLKTVLKKLSYENNHYRKIEIDDIMRYNIANQKLSKEEVTDILNQDFVYFNWYIYTQILWKSVKTQLVF